MRRCVVRNAGTALLLFMTVACADGHEAPVDVRLKGGEGESVSVQVRSLADRTLVVQVQVEHVEDGAPATVIGELLPGTLNDALVVEPSRFLLAPHRERGIRVSNRRQVVAPSLYALRFVTAPHGDGAEPPVRAPEVTPEVVRVGVMPHRHEGPEVP
ncbi:MULTISPECIES: hypothetical protein [Dyella]|uniref:Lipoprotein n=2 Tax=Dyella TaxID=231454 RepID=A0A4V2NMH1_9GAMM|nr:MULTISPECIES: hypothetical protein [Dyella]TBR39085.1 hypothetical protein EYV96_02245 [Dyella terrae]TCI13327.1 hypothetical protein EZM97_08620 [Dyella soli]